MQAATTVLTVIPLAAVALIGLFWMDGGNFSSFNVSGDSNYGAITAGTYILGTVAVMGVLPMETLAGSTGPFADAATEMWGSFAGDLVALGAIISAFGEPAGRRRVTNPLSRRDLRPYWPVHRRADHGYKQPTQRKRSCAMKRRTLDILFSVGGLGLAGLLLVLGIVMTSNANFAKDYVRDQLAQQKITFKTVGTLTAEEKQAPCLVEYAGQNLTTGKQAECYANEFIGLHVKNTASGMTYAELGTPQTALRTTVAEAQKTNDPTLPALQKQLADITTQRETLFKGETLRGLLLTSYGFSVFGVKGEQVATVAYVVAGLLALLSLAGFAHAFRTPRSKGFAVVEADIEREGKQLLGV